jgi:hypothetical protein
MLLFADFTIALHEKTFGVHSTFRAVWGDGEVRSTGVFALEMAFNLGPSLVEPSICTVPGLYDGPADLDGGTL